MATGPSRSLFMRHQTCVCMDAYKHVCMHKSPWSEMCSGLLSRIPSCTLAFQRPSLWQIDKSSCTGKDAAVARRQGTGKANSSLEATQGSCFSFNNMLSMSSSCKVFVEVRAANLAPRQSGLTSSYM